MGGMHGEIRGLNKGECAELFLELRDGTLKHWSIDPNTRSKRWPIDLLPATPNPAAESR